MGNYVEQNIENLQPRHYVLLANKGHHWFNAYPGVVADYRARYGDNFCLVLWRAGVRDDAYVVPYANLKGLFVESNLERRPRKTPKWHGQVKDGHLTLFGRGEPVNVNGLHNAFQLLAIGADSPEGPSVAAGASEITFGLERDLQRSLRSNIAQLEKGLTIIDGGAERSTDAGRIDITARDGRGRTVVIELKAGTALPESLTQLLAYMSVNEHRRRPTSPRPLGRRRRPPEARACIVCCGRRTTASVSMQLCVRANRVDDCELPNLRLQPTAADAILSRRG